MLRRLSPMLVLTACSDAGLSVYLKGPEAAITDSGGGCLVGRELTLSGLVSDSDGRTVNDALIVTWSVYAVDADREESLDVSGPDASGVVAASWTPAYEGAYEVTLRVTDADALFADASVSFACVANHAPTSTIVRPSSTDALPEDELTWLYGHVFDEETLLDQLAVEWTSSLDGVVLSGLATESGETTDYVALSPGDHVLTLSVTDGDGESASDQVAITVGECLDEDNDGSILAGTCATGDDCDDTDPAVNPSATEVCDGTDNDCDGEVDEDDAADVPTWYTDADGDGHGDPTTPMVDCTPRADQVSIGDDCNDTDAGVSPDATETCNDVDDDCDDAVDEGLDADGDGIVDCHDAEDCDGVDNDGDGDVDEGTADADGDGTCDALDAEECDGVDNDGDGEVDEASATDAASWYADTDDDGYGAGAALTACEAPGGYVADDNDCDDADDAVYPGAEELCDGVDNDCNSSTSDGGTDADGDGYYLCDGSGEEEDCDDGDDTIHPGAEEICDGEDNNCNGEYPIGEGVDDDGDGALACECSDFDDAAACEVVADCDDGDSTVYPGATEVCDAQDNDCDGSLGTDETTDADSDGSVACEDCDDADAMRSPDFAEVCLNGVDDDCDGIVDWCSVDQVDVTIYGEDTSDHAGTGLAIGDLDDDGVLDVAIGVPGAGTNAVGEAYVYSGAPSASDTLATAEYRFEGTVTDEQIGGTLAIGDVTDDGVADLLVRAVDAVYALPGPISSGSAVGDAWILDGAGTYGSQRALSSGDVDGDGDADVLVGNEESWVAYLVDGPVGTDVDLATGSVATMSGAYTFTGMEGSNSGDVDGDGYDDILVGAYNWYAGTAGRVYLAFGPVAGSMSLDADADVIFEQSVDGDGLGMTIDCREDANGDGYDDILLGLPGVDYAASGGGAVYLVDGRARADWSTVTLASATAVIYGEESGGVGANAHLGDVSDDAVPDILFNSGNGATGNAYAFYGPLSGTFLETEADASVGGAGGLGDAADIDADGVPDILLANANESTNGTYAGAVYVIFGGF
ncbi:FG-GAP repeat protein [Candidatus Uhrbacteria bacterium]|nr:FG-GAP repeat protein [Candidatus Uhrbacteria bacterium]